MIRPSRRQPGAALFALALLAQACPAGAAQPRIAVSAAQAQALGIETVAVAAPGQAAAVTLPAQVAVPNNQVQAVAAPLPGLVQSLGAAPGEHVRKGQVLARIASPMLLEVQREYLNAASQAQLTALNAKRDEQLWQEGIIAESRHQASRNAAAQASIALAERRQALRLAGLPDKAIADLGAGRAMNGVIDIASPIDGVVLEQTATVGSRTEQSALLYKVARLDPLWLEIQVPVKLAAGLREGARARVAGADAASSGRIIAIGRQVNADNQTVSVRAVMSEGAALLRPGQFVEAVLDLPAGAAPAWRIPAAGLLRMQDRNYVFVQRTGSFDAVEVQLAGTAGEQALVTAAHASALKEGDRIAVKGVAALKAAWMGIGRQ
ncbi:MAG: efflux RND transporter periplasmic adaptor subunit [Proteobacteria bacterium]|nr:efflux RND transporter periplasmic adaptor subunit [Pseudomonadota bacterium]